MYILNTVFAYSQVIIGGVKFQLDCMFGSGRVSDSFQVQDTKSYTSDYFATNPHQFILTHWPTNPVDQLLESSLTFQEIQDILPVPLTTLKQGIIPITWCETINVPIESQNPTVSIDVGASNDHVMSANLVAGSGIELLPEECFDQNIHLQRIDNYWKVNVAVPSKGQYKLNIVYKPCGSGNDSDHGLKPCGSGDDSDHGLCLSYTINCEADLEFKIGYPKVHNTAITEYDLNLIHWNNPAQSYMCQNLSGLLNLIFEAKSNIHFDHYILPGKIENPTSFAATNVSRYNTLLFSNKGVKKSTYQLQAVFPTSGWWTVALTGALPTDQSWKYTPLVTYHIYITVGLPRNLYPHVLSSDITFNCIRPITSTGEEVLQIQFASIKQLDFRHYLTLDQPTNEPQEGFSKIEFEGKVRGSDCYVYGLKVIFSCPGNWFIHVFGQGKERKGKETAYRSLFKLNMDVRGAKKNTSFINYKSTVGESFGIHLLEDGLLTFPDSGAPLHYSFTSLANISFFHALKSAANEMLTHDYCTYLSSEVAAITGDRNSKHGCLSCTIHAVFPENGKWLVQLFGAKEGSTNYSLVFTLKVNVSNSSPQLCYPKINPAFYKNNMSIDTNHALISRTCEGGEFELHFKAPRSVHFTWSMESAGQKCSNAFIHNASKESLDRSFHVLFPKPGEWLIRLFSKETAGKSGNYRSVLELRLNSLSFTTGFSFPQVFEAFYFTFGLYFDRMHLPLISHIKQLPAKVIIPLYSHESDLLFMHDVDVKDIDDSIESYNLEDQCKLISDPSTGQHKLIIEVNTRGKWTVSLYAKQSVAVEQPWIAVLKFVLTTA